MLVAVSENESSPGAEPRPRHPVHRRIVVAVVLIFFAWHGWATVAWLSGSATLMRIGPVEAYVNPIFRQHWSVFAPNPEDFNTRMQVRAELAGGEVTEWFDVTAQDARDSIQGVPILSRMYQSNFTLSLITLNDVNQVTDEERGIIVGDGEVLAHEQLGDRLEAAGSTIGGRLERLLNDNWALTVIASEIARARWAGGEAADVVAVQSRILVERTPRAPWLASDGPAQYLFDWEPGWREPIWHEGIDPTDIEQRYGADVEAAR